MFISGYFLFVYTKLLVDKQNKDSSLSEPMFPKQIFWS